MAEPAPDPLDAAATGARLRALHRRDVIDEQALADLLRRASAGPGGGAWAQLLDRALLAVGAGLCVAAVIYFFAGNWAELPDAVKLGSAMAGVALSAGWAWRAPERRSGRVALTAAAGLTGALLAVYGQIYQTGADVWTLFAAWAALLVPWVLAARDEPLTILWLLVGSLGLWLAMDQGAVPVDHELSRVAVLAAVPGVAWLAAERLPEPRRPAGWFVRVVATAFFACITVIGFALVLGDLGGGGPPAALAFAAALVPASWTLGLARSRPIDLYLASVVWLVAIIVFTTLLGRIVFEGAGLDAGGFLMLAIAVILQVAGAAIWLRAAWRRGAR